MTPGKDFIGIGCGAIIINDKNEILLLKRTANSRIDSGLWARPGGQVEFGETIAEAVGREVKEETGIVIKVIRQLEMFENISEDKTQHWISFGFLAEHVSGEPTNTEPDKHDEIKWFLVDQLPNNLAEHTKKSVEVYLKTAKII